MADFKGRYSLGGAAKRTPNQETDGDGAMRDSPNKEVLDNPGFQVGGYIDKKGVTAAEAKNPDTRYNMLPPGMYIDNQENADIRSLPMKYVTDMGYPGDGWSGASEDFGV